MVNKRLLSEHSAAIEVMSSTTTTTNNEILNERKLLAYIRAWHAVWKNKKTHLN